MTAQIAAWADVVDMIITMRRTVYVALVALVLGAVVVSAVWYWAARTQSGEVHRFQSCQLKGSDEDHLVLVLKYQYGANEKIDISVDATGEDVTVGFRTRQGGGARPAVGLYGEVRFALFGKPHTIRDADGNRLGCSKS